MILGPRFPPLPFRRTLTHPAPVGSPRAPWISVHARQCLCGEGEEAGCCRVFCACGRTGGGGGSMPFPSCRSNPAWGRCPPSPALVFGVEQALRRATPFTWFAGRPRPLPLPRALPPWRPQPPWHPCLHPHLLRQAQVWPPRNHRQPCLHPCLPASPWAHPSTCIFECCNARGPYRRLTLTHTRIASVVSPSHSNLLTT
jgi:hypothetical protein